MAPVKQISKQREKPKVVDLWDQVVVPIPIKKYVKEAADSEKMIVFSETGAGKTRFYLMLLESLLKRGISKEDLKMFIIFPDRPNGLAKLYDLIPKEYQDSISIFPVGNYEDTIIATASAEKALEEHYKKTGVHGWMIFELMENYWAFSMNHYCIQAYGKTMGEYFAQMQEISDKEKAEKKTAYEAFAGPFGGPWPIIKWMHNFNWIDKLKRMPYNIIFTSELKEEQNKDGIFSSLGYRPAGEKHCQHKVDTILYLSHKANSFFMKPYKLTGYTRLYGELNVTGKNAFDVHTQALKRLKELGHHVSKMKDIENQAGITPPKKKTTQPKPQESKKPTPQEPKEEPKKETKKEKETEGVWNI